MKNNKVLSKIPITAIFLSLLPTGLTFADQCSPDVCSGSYPDSVKAACGCSTSNTDNLPVIIVNILNAIIGVSGLIAVIFIIVGGIQYMTSTGDAAKTKKAKDTILYALIGLVVCVLAFAIVNFVISNIIMKNN